jgi:excisionase family DNA binding protein
MTTDDGDRYLNIRELSAYAGLSEPTLRRLQRDPILPLPVYRIGGRLLVKRSEFDAWVQAASGNGPAGRGGSRLAPDRLDAIADLAVRGIRGR